MSVAGIKQELRAMLHLLNKQMLVVTAEAEKIGCKPEEIRSSTGEFMLVPLLVARAHVLTALANLEKS